MQILQAKIKVAGGRIQKIEPQYGGVTIVNERNQINHFRDAWVMPGLVESHAHLHGLGQRLLGLKLYDCTSAEECVQRAADHINDGEWLHGMGWNQEKWPDGQLPTRALLDEAFPDRPVVMRRADGHAVWVNSQALQRAGITGDTPDPAGGRILRDDKRQATGVLVDNAMDLVLKHAPPISPEQIRRHIESAAAEYAKLGVTEVHDMDVHPSLLDHFRELAERGNLAVRVQSHISGQNNEWLHERLLPAGGEFLRVYAVKLYADGALGSRGAYLLQPYADDASTRGLVLLSAAKLHTKIKTILEYGWNVSVHAIGDAANRNVIDAYEYMRRERIADDQTILRIEHAQIVTPRDQERLGKIGIIPAVQASHCVSDAPMARLRLGEERCRYAYPWRSLRNNGALLAGGSDAPIESPDPLIGIDAFCRRIPFGEEESWNPQECITREEALLAYTEWAHTAADMDYRRGKLKEKFDADFVVVDRNLLTCPDEEIRGTKVLGTWSGGVRRWVDEGRVENQPPGD